MYIILRNLALIAAKRFLICHHHLYYPVRMKYSLYSWDLRNQLYESYYLNFIERGYIQMIGIGKWKGYVKARLFEGDVEVGSH